MAVFLPTRLGETGLRVVVESYSDHGDRAAARKRAYRRAIDALHKHEECA